ncbi:MULTISPECIES: hypothetical protein [Amycolatopsis]|uniref:hypothetical protein n=1 Tax=Amycolatopsis TaxID=1813 RepID=UPI0018E38FFB|nr:MULTISPECIES: hypothetical protein [Amycolatopsis]
MKAFVEHDEAVFAELLREGVRCSHAPGAGGHMGAELNSVRPAFNLPPALA